VEDRPDLAIVDGELWQRVHDRLDAVHAAYGVSGHATRPRGQAPELYSPYLLSGLLRCDRCGARITIQTSQRKKHGVVYRYGRYRCSFHVTKGPAVCSNTMSIRQDVLDEKLLETFKTALTPAMIDYLVTATNQTLAQLHDATPQEISALAQERHQVERELSNLVEFVAQGDQSPHVRAEIRAREQRVAKIDQQLDRLRAASAPASRPIDRAWVEARLQKLTELLRTDPAGARREIQKHVEDLRIAPSPEAGARVVRVTGRAKVDGLLGSEEAVRLQLVAGARFGLETFA